MNTLDVIQLPLELQQVLSAEQAWHYGIIPKSSESDSLAFFVDEGKLSVELQQELEILFGKDIFLEPLSTDAVKQALSTYYRKDFEKEEGLALKRIKHSDFLAELISEARRLGSSDIHLESYEEKSRVRFRIDGQLVERYSIDSQEYPALINKIKIRANLDISEKRLPQDGRIHFQDHSDKFDIRVSALPTLHGEKIVLRLLHSNAAIIDIEKVGFSESQLKSYLHGIKKPHGIVLISGPTGSGKTTTLYATLKILNKKTSNILTIEDPIEYTLEGINQVQLKEAIGLSFASALRTFLRQDPDIIMVGEIRDTETAKMAVRAALTGHLVLSTIHTNSAWGIVSRLADLEVPPFLIAGILNLAVAQRLLRTLCPNCKKKAPLGKEELPRNFLSPFTLNEVYKPVGCEQCYYTGYKGRRAIYEVISIGEDLAEKIRNRDFTPSGVFELQDSKSLRDNAFSLLAEGYTSLDEVYPVLSSGL